MAGAAELRTEMCPSSGRSHNSVEGQRRASHWPCAMGATRSSEVRNVPGAAKASVGIIFAGVVNVQRAPVAQIEISLGYHLPEPNDRDLTPLAGDHDSSAGT
jgi:hypothetical protein